MVLEITGRELSRKRAVMAEHRTQTTAIATALGETTDRSWVCQEAFRRPVPADLATATSSNSHLVLTRTAV